MTSINLNAQHVNGMTPFDLAVRLLDILEYIWSAKKQVTKLTHEWFLSDAGLDVSVRRSVQIFF